MKKSIKYIIPMLGLIYSISNNKTNQFKSREYLINYESIKNTDPNKTVIKVNGSEYNLIYFHSSAK